MSDLTPQTQDFEFDKNISPEEQKEILESIDKMVTDAKASAKSEPPSLKATRKGFVFPLIINLLAILTVAASFVLANSLFRQRQANITKETQLYLSTEGTLLEEVRRQSQEKIQAKEEEIEKIQTELNNLRNKNSNLENDMEATIMAKEEALRKEMEAALEAERKVLAAAGRSEAEIQARLREMENDLKAQNAKALEDFRRDAEEALAAERKKLEETIALSQRSLNSANEEKLRLEEENRKKQAELQSQFEEERAALGAQTQEARAQLEALAQAQAQRTLLQDQIDGAYQSLMSRVNRQQYLQALAEIQGLRTFLNSDAIQGYPEFVKSQAVDLFFLETLENDVQNRIDGAEPEVTTDNETGTRLIAAEDLAQKGFASLETGDTEAAEEFFNAALGELPLLAESVRSLEDIARTRRETAVNAALTEGTAQLRRRQWIEAAAQFRIAADRAGEANPELTSSSLEGLVAAYTGQIAEGADAQNALQGEQSAVVTRLRDQLAQRDTTIRGNETTIAERDKTIKDQERIIRGNETAIAERNTTIRELRQNLEAEEKTSARSTEVQTLALSSRNIGRVSRVLGNRITIKNSGGLGSDRGNGHIGIPKSPFSGSCFAGQRKNYLYFN